jgi:LPS sulfotransferase NodH/glycosyltransferase involved in cell wall biosynthesis
LPHALAYFICATERTGSYLLCDALALTCLAGRPQECFHPARRKQLPTPAKQPDYAAFFEQIAQESTTPNGVFGAKVQWWQLKELVRSLRELPEYRGIGAADLVMGWASNVRFIRLTRRDKLRQAISHLKAVQTNVWWETDTWAQRKGSPLLEQPEFNPKAINDLMGRIRVHEAVWQRFFDACGVQPLDIVYEDLVADYAAVTRQVLAHLQIPTPDGFAIPEPRYKKQADDTSEQWAQRFLGLRGAQKALGHEGVPPSVPQEDEAIICSQGATPAAAIRSPLLRPGVGRGPALRIVSYATQELDGLPALLVRAIAEQTHHTAHCVSGAPSPGAEPDAQTIDWTSDPAAAKAALAAADVVLLHDGAVAPEHDALLANKAVIVLAHHAHAQQSPWLQRGFPGAVLHPQLARFAAMRAWPRLSVPWASAEDWERRWMPLIVQALPPPEPHGRVVHRAPQTPSLVAEKPSKRMKITVYPLSDDVAIVQPAPAERAWLKDNAAASADPGLLMASSVGWELCCPYAVEVTWNGGPAPEDISISVAGQTGETPPFVQSQFGGGLLSFHSGYQVQTEGTTSLWVRGPINRPMDGLYPLEQVVETTLVPSTIVVTWQCTRPNQTLRFAQGEPFAVLLPFPLHYLTQFEVELAPPETYAEGLQQRIETPDVRAILSRLEEDATPEAAVATPAMDARPSEAAAPDEPAAAPDATSAIPSTPPSHWARELSAAPPVSCICPTYGRVELLEEAIYAFLQQDYPGPKELIVLNDYADQTLSFEHPEVRVVNLPRRFHSVGEKYQAAVALASHDLIFVWNDDDIYLPHRLSFSVAQGAEGRGFFKASQAWFWNKGRLSGPEGNRFHGGSCFTRELFVAAGGYPHTVKDFDSGFEATCEGQQAGVTRGQAVAPEDLYYLYRWGGTDSYHLSAAGKNGGSYEAVATYVESRADWGYIPSGQVTLNPHWKADYVALVRDYLSNGSATDDAAPAQPEPAKPRFPHRLRFIDTPDGRVDVSQFEPEFFRWRSDPGMIDSLQSYIRERGSLYRREFYVIDSLKLVYLSVPKSACSSIKVALAKFSGIDFDLSQSTRHIHLNRNWHRELGGLSADQDGYHRFSFVRDPFERLVSCYRQKILFTPTAEMPHPHFHNFYFTLPTNTSFDDFARRVCRIPDALSDSHFQSQHSILYDQGKLLVDYVGKLEQVEQDWTLLADRFGLPPLLVHTNVSKGKPGTHHDYRRYYTPELARLVYERYRKDVEAFGYAAEYEQLLAFVEQTEQVEVTQ